MDRLGNTSFTLEPSDDRGYLLTEQTNPNSQNLDLLSTEALVNLFSEEDLQPQRAVRAAIPALVAAIDSITERLQAGGSLYYLGAGTSGRLGVLDAAECPPTFCTQPDLVQGVLAGGEPALLKSSEGLEDLEVAGRDDLASRGFGSDDCLIGIAAGGTTPYVKGGLAYAQSINALTIAMACVPEDQAPLPCSINIRLITGPELLTGSTRLKAGTATKMALNIISTGVMVRLGKVFGNQMIDVSASNSKLVDRALRILGDLAGIDREQGMDLLRLSKGSVKLSLLMVSAGIDVDAARKLLSDHDNQLRLALNSLGCSLSKG
ncbi:MAG: N-acetylmuramic acid 6-phosphate etherase [Prochlorococcus sp.]|jgi:N-acetylmuramic acid 6-phosphate etherase|nr:MAG: N-acetylmuramic acid 6-phosphate etherase [Prochlorococcus marinus str. MIT 9215]